MKFSRNKLKRTDEDTKEMLPIIFLSGMANYARAAYADCCAVHG